MLRHKRGITRELSAHAKHALNNGPRTLSYLPGLLADLPQLWHGQRAEVHGLQLLPQLRLPFLQLCLPRCNDIFRGISAVGGSAAPGAQRRPAKAARAQQRSSATQVVSVLSSFVIAQTH